ncbi:IS110 family transposase [uncultured Microscilla sp.]|uniref:IS110 family transposase n=1 Tax=uncultured Microscilla sp. TaxID=432653 RepID=UPI00261D98FA|nr:IS110 family transposase [uncultured Microscilla sp.]
MAHYIGFDIGKLTIHYAYYKNGELVQGELKNQLDKIEAFIAQLPSGSHGVMEATGLYHFPLAYALQAQGFILTVVNPAASKGYSQSLLSISKTDASDAVMLQRLGEERQLKGMMLPDKDWQTHRHRLLNLQHLQNDIQKLKNRISELSFHPQPDDLSVMMIEDQLELLQCQQKQLEEKVTQELPQNYQKQLVYGVSVKGIGKKTATFLLLFTHGLKDFSSPKALAKFIGIAPNIYQSGRYQKRGRICKKGHPQLRSLLYNCAKSAKRYNSACKALYEKLRAKGKPHKVAMVAIMHKLVRQFFAVIKNETLYQDDYQLNKG